MPIYEITAPDGNTYTIEGPEGATKAQVAAAVLAKNPKAGIATKPETGITAALGKGIEGLISSGRTAFGALTGSPEEAAAAGLARQEALGKKYADQVSLEKVKQAYAERGLLPAAGEVAGQIPYALAEQAPNIASSMAGARLGAMLGSVVPGLGTGVGAIVGGGLGAFAPSFIQQLGGNIERQAQVQKEAGQPLDIRTARAAGYAVPQAVLDVASTFIPLGRNVVGKVLGPEVEKLLAKGSQEAAEKLAKESLAKTLLKGTGVGVAAEVPTEITQQVLERAQAGLSLTDADALKEYGETAYQVGLLAPIGAAGRYAERGAARADIAAKQQEAEAKKAAETRAAEEAKKADPNYLLQISQEYAALEAQKKDLQSRIVRGTKDNPLDEAAKQANREINEQLTKLASDLREKAVEFNRLGGKNAVAKLQEQQRVAGLTEGQYLVETLGEKVPTSEAPAPDMSFVGLTEPAAPAPAPEAQYAQQQMQVAQQQNLGAYEAADFAQYLLQDPAMAQRLVQTKTPIPGVEKKASDAILGMLKLQLAKQETARKEEARQKEALALSKQATDIAAQKRGLSDTALDLWKASVEQTEEQATEELLRPNFETLRPSGPATVAVAPGVQPIQNPKTLLKRIDDLFAARDKAAAETEDAFGAGNRELGAKKAQEREAAQAALNNLGQMEGAPRALMELRKAQDTALMNTAQLADDLKAGRTLGGPEAGTASSTPQTLINQINKQRDAFVTAAVQEAATNRKLFGKALTQDEATKAADQMRDVFNEWVTRSMAAPRKAVEEERVVQPAQMRGTELVKGAETERVDLRPLEERQFGAYRAATQVLQEQLRQIASRLSAVPAEGKRVEPVLKTQFAPSEAAKVAEARGETAKTLEGELRRRREFVGNLIDQAFQTRRVPGIAETLLTRTQDFLPNATQSMLDAAENIASRVVRMQPVERSDLVSLRDELRAASARPGQAEVVGERVGQKELFPAETRREDLGVIRETRARFENAPIVKRARAAAARAKELLGDIKTAWAAADEAQAKVKAAKVEKAEATVEARRDDLRNAFNAALEKAKVAEIVAKFQPQIDAAINQLALFGKERAKAVRAKEIVAAKDIQTIIDMEREELQSLRQQLEDAVKTPSKAVEPAEMKGERQLRELTQPYELAAAADEWVQFERDRLAKAETALAKAKGPEKAAPAKAVAEQRAAVKQAEDITKRAQTGLGLPGVRVQRQAIKAEIAALEERIPTIKDAKKKRSAENRLGSLRKALGESARPIEGEFTSEYVEELRKELRETVKNKKLSAEEREAKLKELNRKLGEVEGRRGATMRPVMERAELTQAEAAKRAEEKTAAQEELENRALAIADEIEDLRGARERARTDASKQDIQAQIDERSKELTLLQGQLETPTLTRTEARKARKPQKTLFSGRGVGSEQDLLGAIAEKIKDKKPLTAYEKRIWEGRAAPKTGLSAKGRKTLSEFSEALRRERKEATRPVGTFGETLGVEDVMSSFEIGGKDVFFSRGETANPSITADVRAELKQHFADFSKVKVYDTVDALIKDNPQYEGRVPDNARGFVDTAGNKAFLIAENIPQGQTLSVALHEVGAHIGMRETMGAQQYNASVKAIENWAKKDDGSIESRVARAAQARVEEAGTTEAQQNDELLAYAIEEAVNAGVKPTETKSPIGRWLGQMLGMFRNALRKFGLAPKELSLQELVDTAYGAAQLELRMPTQMTEVAAPEERGELLFSKPAKYDASVEGAGKVADALIAKQKSLVERVKPNLIGLGFRTQFIDKLAPLEHISRNMMDSLKGTQMMYYLRMYGQKMNFTSQAVGHGVPQLIEKTRKDGRKEWVIESIKDTNLKDVVDVLARDDVKKAAGGADAANRLFTLYLAALRADRVGIDALNFGGKITQAQLDAARAEIEANKTLKSAFDEARDKYNAYNRKLLELAVQTGALNKDHASKLLSSNDYIPFYRVRDGVAELVIGKETPVRIGNLKDSPHLQELVGGDEAIFDFLTSSVQNTTMLLDMSLKNLAQKNVAFELADTGLAHIKKASKTGKAPVNSFTFKKDGEEYYAILDQDKLGKDIPADLLIKGLEGIPTMMPAFMRIAGFPARWLRRLVVATPAYMARQLFRDSLGAYMISGSDAAPMFGALKQIGKASALEQRGVTGGQVFTGMPEDMTRILKEMQEGKPGWTKALAKLEALSMQADSLTRRAQYDSYIKQGLSEMEATLMSLESMNFNKRGVSPSVHMLTTLIPFMNAQIQSLDVLYKAFSGKMPFNDRLKIREKMISRGLMLAAASLAYAAAMQDDDAYKNARPDEKYNNWFVRVPGLDQPVRVPIPFELGYIFKALPEALYNTLMTKHGGEEATEAFTNILRQLIPGGSSFGIPQAVKPLIEVGLGKSLFTGRDIESVSEQRQEPWTRYRDNTSEAAKMLGQLTNTSPVKLESLISGYTGSMGLALLQALNVMLPQGGPEKAEKRLSDMPIVGPFFQPTDASGIIDNTYKALEEATQAAASYKKLIERGEYGKAQAQMQGKLDEISLNALAGRYRQEMGQLTKAETAIKASNMTPEKKREALDTIRQAKIQIATSVRTVLDKRVPQAAPA